MTRVVVPFMLLVSFAASAETEHPSCQDIDQPYLHLSPQELNEIAGNCSEPAMKELLEHRARHAQLVEDHAFFDRIETTGRSVTDWRMDINQIFLSLVEIYTGVMDLSEEQRMSVLQTAYGRANEIADLRLRGYDPQAAQLETWEPTTLLMNSPR